MFDITHLNVLWVNIYTSVWFNFLLRFITLLILIKIIHFCGKKVKAALLFKATDIELKKQISTMVSLIVSITDTVLALIFLLAFLGSVGINIKPLLATAGVTGLIVGFSAKALIEDVLSGILLITSGQIRVGDFVEVAGKAGTVEKISVKLVTLRDIYGRVHFIRNRLIDIVTNYTREYSYALIDFGVGYGEDVDNVCNVIKDVFKNDLMKDKNFAPKVLGEIEMLGLDSFEDSCVTIRIRIKTVPQEHWNVERQFKKLVKKRFDEVGIEIPFPYRTVVFKNALPENLPGNSNR